MIYTTLTKKFFGLSLLGDFQDLERLYNVIHHCADCYAEDSSAKNHLHYFAYEIRHARQGDREQKIIASFNGDKNIYYSTSFALPYYILFVNLMQNSFAKERRLWQTASIWDLTSDLQETASKSGSLDFIQAVDYWAFNTLLNQPRLIPGVDITSAVRDKDYLTIMADYAVYKFKSISAKQRLQKLGQIMNYMHPYSDDHKNAIEDMRYLGISVAEKAHLEFEMLDIRQW
ncbi:MAG: hypothetical protein HOP30_04800 [Cyclobacteriaceae bacterium]|nr:hypothetical protein [Cyclobacteriaceae bacterium]